MSKIKSSPERFIISKHKYEKQVIKLLANAEEIRVKAEIANQIKIVNEHSKAHKDVVSKISDIFDEEEEITRLVIFL